jgi:hypothetical protein
MIDTFKFDRPLFQTGGQAQSQCPRPMPVIVQAAIDASTLERRLARVDAVLEVVTALPCRFRRVLSGARNVD